MEVEPTTAWSLIRHVDQSVNEVVLTTNNKLIGGMQLNNVNQGFRDDNHIRLSPDILN